MKYTKFLALFLPVTLLVMLTSCKKNAVTDAEKPALAFVEPEISDTVNLSLGEELHIEFTATDNAGLHSLEVSLKDQNGTSYLMQTPSVTNLKVYPFHAHLSPALTGPATMTLQVLAEDHSGNTCEANISFLVLP